jgi:hypothetical protein
MPSDTIVYRSTSRHSNSASIASKTIAAGELEFDLAVELAIKLALLAEAKDLPGFFHRESRSK